jgi:hypothetical protein
MLPPLVEQNQAEATYRSPSRISPEFMLFFLLSLTEK